MPDSPDKCLRAIDRAVRSERRFRRRAQDILRLYRFKSDEGSIIDEGSSYNILYANTQVLAATLFSNNPRVQVARRWGKDSSPLDSCVSILITRCIEYFLDGGLGMAEFTVQMARQIKIDYLLVGRAVTRIRYEPQVQQGKIVYQGLSVEDVDWEDYCHGEGRRWREVPWEAFRHWFTDEEMSSSFGESEFWKEKTETDYSDSTEEDHRAAYTDMRHEVWELFDREDRKVKWVCPKHRDKYLRVDDDPLSIPGFFPNPPPLLRVHADDLEPIPEYLTYQTLAGELETVTQRINLLASAIRVRGVYDASISEFKQIFESEDTVFIAAENASAIRDLGGLANAIWAMPIGDIVGALTSLSQYRETVKTLIYEMTGQSDITRGYSDPRETASAQSIKSRYATIRTTPAQKEVETYVRDIVRIMAHIIAQHFVPGVLSAITGVELPSPDYQGITWEQVIQTLRNEIVLSYKIDVETDSTIQDMMAVEQSELKDLLASIAGFVTQIAPAVQGGWISREGVRDLILAVIRKYKYGSEVEAAVEKAANMGPPV